MNKIIYFLGLVLVLVFSLLPLLNPNIVPTILTDISYHLSIAEHFNQSGGVVTWDYWENVPNGRAQLYPPVFHIILAALLQLGFAPILIIKVASLFSYLFLLFSAWFVATKIFNERIGLVAVLLLAASFNFYSITVTTAPASLSIALALWLIYFYLQKKDFNCIILLILMLYLHRFIPEFLIVTLLVYGWLTKEFKRVLKIIVPPAILFLPFLVFLTFQQQYFVYFHLDGSDKNVISSNEFFNVFVIVFGFAALFFVLFWQRQEKYYQKLLPFLISTLLCLPVLILRPNRFYNSIGYVFIAIILAVVLCNLFKKTKWRLFFLFFVVVVLSVQFDIVPGTRKLDYKISPPFYIQIFLPEFSKVVEKNYTFFSKKNLDFFQIIKNNSQINDVLFSATSVFNGYYYSPDNGFIVANFIQAFTGLGVVNARKPEFFNSKLYQPLPPEQVKILIVDLRKTPSFFGQKTDEEKYYFDIISKNFIQIAQVDGLTFAFKNKSQDTYKVKPVKPIAPLWLAYILVFTLIIFGFWGNSILKKPKP